MTIEVTDFDECVYALRQPDLRQSLYDEASLMMERALVNLHGPEHRARRGAEATMFRKDVFLEYEKEVLPRTMAETFQPFFAAGKADLVDLGYRVMINLTVDFTGIDRPLRTSEETAELLRLLREFSLAPALGQSRPEDVPEKRKRIALAIAEFDRDHLWPSIERRRALVARWRAGDLAREELPRDVLTALLINEDKVQLTRAEWVQEGIFYTLAGAHTTIHSLSHAVHELLQWLDTHPEEEARLKNDPFFVQRCVYESLRLHPSSPVARRRALCPVHMPDGDVVDAGDEVIVDLRQANHDQDRFGTDATSFNPHREVSSGFRYGLSMGDGMHACIGRHLAIGVDPKPGAQADTHQYGLVPLIVAALLKAGIRRDPELAPVKDETVTRISWERYPVIFRPQEAWL